MNPARITIGSGLANLAAARKRRQGSNALLGDLIAAKRLVEQLGGVEQARTAIGALAKLV